MSKIILKKGFVTQKVGQKITIFDGDKSVLYTFNPVATFIFEKIKKGMEEEEIVKLVSQKYEISEGIAAIDFREFINDLKKKKII